MRRRHGDRDARLVDLDAADPVVDRDGPEVVALLEVGRDLGHHVLGHLRVSLVLEVVHGAAPRLPPYGAEERRDRPCALVGDLVDDRLEGQRFLGDAKRTSRDGRDQRDFVPVGELAPGVRVLAVDRVEQALGLVTQAERGPDIGDLPDVFELALRVAGPLAQPGEKPHLDCHRIPSFPMATTARGAACGAALRTCELCSCVCLK